MDDGQRGLCIDLAAEQHLTLDNVRGTPVQVTRGTVWITQERSYDDVILTAGDHWIVERTGRTVIQAQDDANLCIKVPAAAWRRALRRRWTQWRTAFTALLRHAMRGWLSLRARRTLPYY